MNPTLVKTSHHAGTVRQKSALPPSLPPSSMRALTLRLLGTFLRFPPSSSLFLHTIRRGNMLARALHSPHSLTLSTQLPSVHPYLTQIQQQCHTCCRCICGWWCLPHSVAKATSEIRREKRGKCDGKRGEGALAPPVS